MAKKRPYKPRQFGSRGIEPSFRLRSDMDLWHKLEILVSSRASIKVLCLIMSAAGVLLYASRLSQVENWSGSFLIGFCSLTLWAGGRRGKGDLGGVALSDGMCWKWASTAVTVEDAGCLSLLHTVRSCVALTLDTVYSDIYGRQQFYFHRLLYLRPVIPFSSTETSSKLEYLPPQNHVSSIL